MLSQLLPNKHTPPFRVFYIQTTTHYISIPLHTVEHVFRELLIYSQYKGSTESLSVDVIWCDTAIRACQHFEEYEQLKPMLTVSLLKSKGMRKVRISQTCCVCSTALKGKCNGGKNILYNVYFCCITLKYMKLILSFKVTYI